jgi:branched-chain amino acid transport system substrate-binding protein
MMQGKNIVKKREDRSDFIRKVSFIIIALFFLVFLGGVSQVAFAEENTIKIAVFEPLSGPLKYVGDSKYGGMKFHAQRWNEKEGGLFGKKIEVIAYDSQLRPDVTLRLATKAVLEDKVHVLASGTGTPVINAMLQVAQQYKKIALTYEGETASTLKNCNPYHFRLSANTAIQSTVLADLFKDKPEFKKFAIISPDYSWGHETGKDFKEALKRIRPDAQIVEEIYNPMGTLDFAPYISRLIASGAQWIFTANWGSDLQLLMVQSNSLGLKAPFLCYYLEDPFALSAIGEAAVGSISADFVSTFNIESTTQKAFNEEWHKVWKQIMDTDDENYQWPGIAMGHSYLVNMLFEAAKKVGKWDEKAIIKAWEGMEYDGLSGKVFMRAEDHQAIQPIPVMRVVPAKENVLYPDKFPGLVLEKLVSAQDATATITLEKTGCTRKPGEF